MRVGAGAALVDGGREFAAARSAERQPALGRDRRARASSRCAADGRIALTRNGDFQLDANGSSTLAGGQRLVPPIRLPQGTSPDDVSIAPTAPSPPRATMIGHAHARRRARPGAAADRRHLFLPNAASGAPRRSPGSTSSRATSRLERGPGRRDGRRDRRAALLPARRPGDHDPGPADGDRQRDPPLMLTPIDTSAIPADVRTAGPEAVKLYGAALQFEGMLVQQLTQQMFQSTQDDSSGDSSTAPAATTRRRHRRRRPTSRMLPQTLSDAITQGGGLGLADELYRSMAMRYGIGTTGAARRRLRPPAKEVRRSDRPDRAPRAADRVRAAAARDRARPERGDPRPGRRGACSPGWPTSRPRWSSATSSSASATPCCVQARRRSATPVDDARRSRTCSCCCPQPTRERARELSAELRGLLAEIERVHDQNRILIRQELSFLDHLMRLMLRARRRPATRRAAGRARRSPPTCRREGLTRCLSPPSSDSRPRCAASSPSSARSTSPATTSRTPTRSATRARASLIATDPTRCPASRARRRPASSAPASTSPSTSASATSFIDIQLPRPDDAAGLQPRRRRTASSRSSWRSTSRATPASTRCSASTGRRGRTSRTAPRTWPPGRRSPQRASSLADGLQPVASQLTTMQSQTSQNVTVTINDVNSIGDADRAAERRDRRPTVTGDQPNDLLDQRDVLIDKLVRLGNVDAHATAHAGRRSTSPSAAQRSSPASRPRRRWPSPSLTSLTSGKLRA